MAENTQDLDAIFSDFYTLTLPTDVGGTISPSPISPPLVVTPTTGSVSTTSEPSIRPVDTVNPINPYMQKLVCFIFINFRDYNHAINTDWKNNISISYFIG